MLRDERPRPHKRVVATCECCGDPIHEGETYYDFSYVPSINLCKVCKGCVEYAREEAESYD